MISFFLKIVVLISLHQKVILIYSTPFFFYPQSTDAGREEFEVENRRLQTELERRCRELELEKQASLLGGGGGWVGGGTGGGWWGRARG